MWQDDNKTRGLMMKLDVANFKIQSYHYIEKSEGNYKKPEPDLYDHSDSSSHGTYLYRIQQPAGA
jgi:hypothetical protein